MTRMITLTRRFWFSGDKHTYNIPAWNYHDNCEGCERHRLMYRTSILKLSCRLLLTAEMNFVYFGFFISLLLLPFPSFPLFSCIYRFIRPDLLFHLLFLARSFFFPYQLFARWWVCESCLIYSSVESHAGQEASPGYSVNVCMFVKGRQIVNEREMVNVCQYMQVKSKSYFNFHLWLKTGMFVSQLVLFICLPLSQSQCVACCLPSCLITHFVLVCVYSTCIGWCHLKKKEEVWMN